MKKRLLGFLFYFVCCLASLSSENLKLVWQVDPTNLWEQDWFNEVFEGLELDVVVDGKYEQFFEKSIVIVSGATDSTLYEDYFTKLHEKGCKFGVIMIGDEYYTASEKFYPLAEFVIKNHWHKKYRNQEKILVIPLGYKKGFWKNAGKKQVQDILQRPFTWSFAGNIATRPTRVAMHTHMKEIPHFFVHEIGFWADPQSLSPPEYRDLLLKSVFIPCPRGDWNLDSFRVYEALECGCIPIVEKGPIDYFGGFLGDHPCLVIESWDQAPALIANLLSNPHLLEKKRLECTNWWLDYKKEMRKKVATLVKGTFQMETRL